MNKKKKLDKSKKANQSTKAQDKAANTSKANQSHSEYGGLPDRDLKKNLGCG